MQIRRVGSAAAGLILALLAASSAAGLDAVGWRRDGNGRFATDSPPVEWSKDSHVVWKTQLPGSGICSPIVVGERVFTQAEPATLVALDRKSGEILWQQTHTYRDALGDEQGEKIEAAHAEAKQLRKQIDELHRDREKAKKDGASDDDLLPVRQQIEALEKERDRLYEYPPVPEGTPGNTTSTPVSDGRRIWSVFGTGIVSAHDVDGSRVWIKYVDNPRQRHSASPLLIDTTLVVQLRRLVALDADTGEEIWRIDNDARAGTPVATNLDGLDVIVTPSGSVLRAADGKLLARRLFDLQYCSPIVEGDVVYAVENGTTKAVRLARDGDEEVRHEVVWEAKGARDDRLGSPVVHDGLLYAATGKGVLEVLDAATGEQVYRQRLDFKDGRVDPSLAVAGPYLYVSSHRGTTLVVRLGRSFELVAKNELENFSSSAAFDGNRLFVRTERNLFCIGDE